jgi:hypothetical protein
MAARSDRSSVRFDGEARDLEKPGIPGQETLTMAQRDGRDEEVTLSNGSAPSAQFGSQTRGFMNGLSIER